LKKLLGGKVIPLKYDYSTDIFYGINLTRNELLALAEKLGVFHLNDLPFLLRIMIKPEDPFGERKKDLKTVLERMQELFTKENKISSEQDEMIGLQREIEGYLQYQRQINNLYQKKEMKPSEKNELAWLQYDIKIFEREVLESVEGFYENIAYKINDLLSKSRNPLTIATFDRIHNWDALREVSIYLIVPETLHMLDAYIPYDSMEVSIELKTKWDIRIKEKCEKYELEWEEPSIYFLRREEFLPGHWVNWHILYGLELEKASVFELLKHVGQPTKEDLCDDFESEDAWYDSFIDDGSGIDKLNKKWEKESSPLLLVWIICQIPNDYIDKFF
jgi:hypothetical protein